MHTIYRPSGLAARASICLVVSLSAAVPLIAQQQPVRPSDRPTVQLLTITPADGRILLAEEMANPGQFSVTLAPGPTGLYVAAGGKVVLTGTARGPYAASCPLKMWGAPVITGNRLGLTGLTLVTEGYTCQAALAVAEAQVRSGIASHPWDLAERLARASTNPALPGPRLPGTGCISQDQIQLQSVAPSGQNLVVRLTLLPRSGRGGCP